MFNSAKNLRADPASLEKIISLYDQKYAAGEGLSGDDLRAAVAKYDADMKASTQKYYADKRARDLYTTEMEPNEKEETYGSPEDALRSLYKPDIGPESYNLHKSPKTGRFFGRGRYNTSGT
jgi:hypothetical protein